MANILLCLVLLVLAIAIGYLVHRLRSGHLPKKITLAITGLCIAALLAMILTDWPLGLLSQFWAEHSVLAGVLSSLLLVFLVFLVYERGEQELQIKLSNELSGAGLGGVVDHVIDLEVALSLLTVPVPPDEFLPEHWRDWRAPGKPLRWLRNGRDILTSELDPRKRAIEPDQLIAPWGPELIDQAIRRLLGGMRDWTPLIGASGDGIAVLLILSEIRRDLMALHDLYPSQGASVSDFDRRKIERSLETLRTRLRLLAPCFEDWSGAQSWRPEILRSIEPLGSERPRFNGIGHSLATRICKTGDALGMRPE